MKVQSDLVKALSIVFLRLNLQYIQVKHIGMSKDLRKAYVEVGAIDNIHTDEDALRVIKSRVSIIKRELGKHISMKYFPSLNFMIDAHRERVNVVEEILQKLKLESPEEREVDQEVDQETQD